MKPIVIVRIDFNFENGSMTFGVVCTSKSLPDVGQSTIQGDMAERWDLHQEKSWTSIEQPSVWLVDGRRERICGDADVPRLMVSVQ